LAYAAGSASASTYPITVPFGWPHPALPGVALADSTGASIPIVATSLLLSQNTIKTHLRRVYAKTGTNRQAELARIIASLGLLKSDDPGSKW